jgi:hypothetical protein
VAEYFHFQKKDKAAEAAVLSTAQIAKSMQRTLTPTELKTMAMDKMGQLAPHATLEEKDSLIESNFVKVKSTMPQTTEPTNP